MQDSDFYRTLTMVIVALGVFFVIIIVAANMISTDEDPANVDSRTKAKIEETIKPVGQVNTGAEDKGDSATPAPAPAPAAGFDAAAEYQSKCFACHGTGAAGAPKLGDKAAWATRIAAGEATVVQNAIKGKGAMPPKGGQASLTDDQVKAMVQYMINQSK